MDRATFDALCAYLRQFITFSAGQRVGRLLPQSFESHGCDHTLSKTTEWLKSQGRNVEADRAWLREYGGECDCKVITSVMIRLDQEI
ncbi:MAG: DUF2695 domain-containing protein [Candidatus Abyssobacteria bacterium SURF_17]|uniref:DUF2695 domain-containing protein n=1 Tax=Candidatus Abyssobacteria bacterium SURF_17 TaxID=2093361 RepID=A0A419F736_9BACT|nr:MAG: DUF2695 domain-containing protein [Candidatus Abyssubacteria bacterium SURF_17]